MISVSFGIDITHQIIRCDGLVPEILLNAQQYLRPECVIVQHVPESMQNQGPFAVHIPNILMNMVDIIYTNDRFSPQHLLG